MPQPLSRWAQSAAVVDLPSVPPMESTGPSKQAAASSISLQTSTSPAAHLAQTGCSVGLSRFSGQLGLRPGESTTAVASPSSFTP